VTPGTVDAAADDVEVQLAPNTQLVPGQWVQAQLLEPAATPQPAPVRAAPSPQQLAADKQAAEARQAEQQAAAAAAAQKAAAQKAAAQEAAAQEAAQQAAQQGQQQQPQQQQPPPQQQQQQQQVVAVPQPVPVPVPQPSAPAHPQQPPVPVPVPPHPYAPAHPQQPPVPLASPPPPPLPPPPRPPATPLRDPLRLLWPWLFWLALLLGGFCLGLSLCWLCRRRLWKMIGEPRESPPKSREEELPLVAAEAGPGYGAADAGGDEEDHAYVAVDLTAAVVAANAAAAQISALARAHEHAMALEASQGAPSVRSAFTEVAAAEVRTQEGGVGNDGARMQEVGVGNDGGSFASYVRRSRAVPPSVAGPSTTAGSSYASSYSEPPPLPAKTPILTKERASGPDQPGLDEDTSKVCCLPAKKTGKK